MAGNKKHMIRSHRSRRTYKTININNQKHENVENSQITVDKPSFLQKVEAFLKKLFRKER